MGVGHIAHRAQSMLSARCPDDGVSVQKYTGKCRLNDRIEPASSKLEQQLEAITKTVAESFDIHFDDFIPMRKPLGKIVHRRIDAKHCMFARIQASKRLRRVKPDHEITNGV